MTRLAMLPVAAALLLVSTANAFQQPLPSLTPRPSYLASRSRGPLYHQSTASTLPLARSLFSTSTSRSTTPTALSMYNLPPSGGGGGGGGGKDNAISQALGGILTIAGAILFFASPLGGIFFAITNSFFLLLLLTPILLTVAFNVWQAFNTIEGTCPNCGAPSQRVVKDAGTGLCFNCGAILQATADQKGIALMDLERDAFGGGVVDMDEPPMGTSVSMMDQLFGGPPRPPRPSQSPEVTKEKASQFRREQTIIDVDVDDTDVFR